MTKGVHAIVRHPSYLGPLVHSLGWALVFRSAVGVLLALLNLPPLTARVKAEEAMLLSQFGGEYDQYRARTWRHMPLVY